MNGGGNEDQREVAQTPVELGETQVVAHRECGPPARQPDGNRFRAGLDRAALVVAFLAACERKEMDLVVARDTRAIGTVHEACAAYARRVRARDGHGPADHPHAMAARKTREECLLLAATRNFAHGDLVGSARAEDAEVLGQHDEPRACRDGLGDERRGRIEIRRDVIA